MKPRILCILLAIGLASPAATALGATRVISFVGDTTSSAYYSPPGIAALVGKLINVPTHDLVVRTPPSYDMLKALAEQVPAIPADTTDVVVWLGLEDVRALAEGQEQLAKVLKANDDLIAALRARKVRIYELTLRDYTQEKAFRAERSDVKLVQNAPAIVEALNAHFKATPGITVVDVSQWKDIYAGRWSSDGFHLGVDALPVFAKHLADALSAP